MECSFINLFIYFEREGEREALVGCLAVRNHTLTSSSSPAEDFCALIAWQTLISTKLYVATFSRVYRGDLYLTHILIRRRSLALFFFFSLWYALIFLVKFVVSLLKKIHQFPLLTIFYSKLFSFSKTCSVHLRSCFCLFFFFVLLFFCCCCCQFDLKPSRNSSTKGKNI